uniref:PHD-type domain-containing protein n=1 Tax=Glossina brevipalpis TaxID=37001 RepID=A0A1A9WQ66_9MUSC
MDCLCTNCNSKTGTSYDRFLVCSLCQRLGHPKCAGPTGRAADAVVDSSKGLCWSCPDCRTAGRVILIFIGCLVKRKPISWKSKKKISATRSVASGPLPTSSGHILIPDAVPSTAPVMANSPVAPVDLVDLSSPNPQKAATLPVQKDQTVLLDEIRLFDFN